MDAVEWCRKLAADGPIAAAGLIRQQAVGAALPFGTDPRTRASLTAAALHGWGAIPPETRTAACLILSDWADAALRAQDGCG